VAVKAPHKPDHVMERIVSAQQATEEALKAVQGLIRDLEDLG
jgi:hypothetical protein